MNETIYIKSELTTLIKKQRSLSRLKFIQFFNSSTMTLSFMLFRLTTKLIRSHEISHESC